jgi:hypothetical protein
VDAKARTARNLVACRIPGRHSKRAQPTDPKRVGWGAGVRLGILQRPMIGRDRNTIRTMAPNGDGVVRRERT